VLADATSTDPIVAARDATDRLLVKLGRSPAAIAAKELSPARDDLLQRTGAAMLADQLDAARAMIDDAAPDLRAAPEMQQRIAQIELRGGEYDAVEQRLVALIDTLDPKRDASLRARALITLASSYVRRNRFDKASEAYEEAIALRNDARDPEVLGMAHLGRGIGLAQSGKFDEAADELGRARIELETSGDALGIAQVYVNLGDFQVMRNRPADALPMLRNAEKRFAELGAREGAVYTGTSIAAVERALLDPAAALATTDRFWPPEAHTSNPRMQWRAVRSRIEALVANGRLGDADALIARARRESDPTRDAALRAQVDAIAAAVAWLRGSEADAAKLAAAAETQTLRNGDAALYAANLALLADALRARGDVAGAGEATKRLRAFADEEHDARVTLEASIAEAAQAWATDRRDAALAGYAAALKSAEALNVPDALVAAGAPYIAALIGASHLDDARSVSSRVAPWADRDLRAATAQALLFRALDRADAARNAEAQAKRLAGDGALPKALAESVSGSR
jgi:tetratricopeptide (TPR) repeat protein